MLKHLAATQFTFSPLQQADLALLAKWLNKTHMKQWWDDHLTDERIIEKYSQLIGNKIVVAFIVYANDQPIG
jgi:hypothetical protein